MAHPAKVQSGEFADAETVAVDIEVSKVIWSRADTQVSVGSNVTTTVFTDYVNSPGSLKGTVAEVLWPDPVTATDQLVTLRYDPYGRSEFELDGLLSKADGLGFVPDVCQFTTQFMNLARRLGRTPDLSLYIDYATEIEQNEKCQAGAAAVTSSPPSCPAPIDEVANRTSHGVPEPPGLSADEIWRNSDPATRSLAFADVPADLVDKLVLLGVHVVFKGKPLNSIFTMRCELGVGVSWAPQGLAPVFPVSTCRDSPLEVLVGDGSEGSTVIGKIDPSTFNSQDGMEVVIDFQSDPIIVSSRALNPGELEQITGWDAATLEGLRLQYSTPSTAPSSDG
jgi:hypothetical protein